MNHVQCYVDNLTDDQIGEVYKFYDSGGYDHLMTFTHKEMPRKDISQRRRILKEYLFDSIQEKEYYDSEGVKEHDNSGDVNEFLNVMQDDTPFEDFRLHIQNQWVNEPLMHRLNQATRSPVLRDAPVSKEMKESQLMEELLEIRDLLKEIFQAGRNPPYIYSDEIDKKVKEAISSLEELITSHCPHAKHISNPVSFVHQI